MNFKSLKGKNTNLENRIRRKNDSKSFRFGLHKVFTFSLIFLFSLQVFSQRQWEYLDRGLVAVKSNESVFISWRILSSDNENTEFNLYRNGDLVNSAPIKGISNYTDSEGTENDVYYVQITSEDDVTEFSNPVSVWKQQYKTIPLQTTGRYYPNDCSVGDLDGDGEMEIIVKIQADNPDNTHEVVTQPVMLNAYKLDGTMLWSINLGVNIRAGAHYTQFMVYDLDGDGISEIACKTAPGTKDGTGKYLSKGPAANDDDSKSYVDFNGRILTGPEYLTAFDGLNGEEISTVRYEPRRHPNTDFPTSSQLDDIWGDGYGNRVDRFLAGVAYFEDKPSLVMCRGYYTRTVLVAYDLIDGQLTQRWVFDTRKAYFNYGAQGNHNLSIADVDQDGKDEIVYGAMCVDDDGTGLWTTGLGHGDAAHVSDIDPSRPGLEKWGITEPKSTSGSQLLDAKTGEIIWGTPAADVGRGVSADITADFPGMECWGGTDQLRSAKNEYVGKWPSSANFLAWWDGDLLRELLDGNTVTKYNRNGNDIRLLTADGCLSNNGSKSTPNFSGDILGDWREEIILRTADNKSLRIYTTTIPSEHGLYTLLQDPQYRLALAWQNVAYNQPPHTGFFLGHGMDEAPVPDIKILDGKKIPSLHMNSPQNGYELELGRDLDVIISANGLSETVGSIVIYNGTTAIDTIKAAPYYVSIPGLTTGSYTLVAKALDMDGNQIESNSVNITVDKGMPKVSITSPMDGKSILTGRSVSISANAYDSDGTIDSLQIYLNNELFSTLEAEPYLQEIENLEAGIYNIKIVAYDNLSNSTASEIVQFIVGIPETIEESQLGFCGFTDDQGTIDSNHSGFSGSGFANTSNIMGAQLNWTLKIPATGTYKFEWRYAGTSDRPGKLFINGKDTKEVPFAKTADWNVWSTTSVTANAEKGTTKIILEAITGSGLCNIDYLKVYSIETNEVVTGLECSAIVAANKLATSSENISVFPIPTSDILNIKAHSIDESISTVSIFSIDGKRIKTQDNLNSNQVKLSTADIKNGIYILNVKSNKGQYRYKLKCISGRN